jgi:hypothetical protein
MPKDRLLIASFENTVTPILPWRIMRSGSAVTANLSAITAPARTGKNMYGALTWAVGQFAGAKGRKVVIVFTDGRDARLTPRWFQSGDGHEILDPLAGLVDDGEAEDFKRTVDTLSQSNVQVYFVAPYPDRNARFTGPSGSDYSLNGISGNSSLSDAYLHQVRARLEQLSKATSGAVFFAGQPAEAPALYANLPHTLKLSSSYHLVFSPSERSNRAPLIEVKIRNGEFRAAQSRTTY